MADKRRAAAALAAERDKRGAGGSLLIRSLATLLVLFLLALPALWACGFFSIPAAVAEVKQLVDQQVAEYGRVARGEVPYGAAPSFAPMMEKMREVPREYREQVGQQMGRLWEARERAELASYFTMPPAQRQAELDRRIKADEERRKAWQAEREKRDQARAAEGRQAGNATQGGDRGGGGPAAGTPGGGPPGGGGQAAGGGQVAGGRTEDGRNERSKRRIDQSSPEQRAQQAEYRRAMDARRRELGLPSGGGRRGG